MDEDSLRGKGQIDGNGGGMIVFEVVEWKDGVMEEIPRLSYGALILRETPDLITSSSSLMDGKRLSAEKLSQFIEDKTLESTACGRGYLNLG